MGRSKEAAVTRLLALARKEPAPPVSPRALTWRIKYTQVCAAYGIQCKAEFCPDVLVLNLGSGMTGWTLAASMEAAGVDLFFI